MVVVAKIKHKEDRLTVTVDNGNISSRSSSSSFVFIPVIDHDGSRRQQRRQ